MAARRRWYWLGVLAAIGLLVAGTVVAVAGYTATQGPDGVVRGYFDALAGSDAATALAYGTVPAGPHSLLTDAVLREQNRIAPLSDVAVRGTSRRGDHATVTVRYTLGFPKHPQTVSVQVGVHRAGDSWRLDAVAVSTQLQLSGAQQRASILGGPVPEETALLFPGAVPIRFDTPYLELDPDRGRVTFGAQPSTLVLVRVSDAGRQAVMSWLTEALRACLTSGADPGCPQPDERYVPGTLRGALAGSPSDSLTVAVDGGLQGWLLVGGTQPVQATSYQRLDFENRPVTGHGRVSLQVSARAYPVPPLRVVWTAS